MYVSLSLFAPWIHHKVLVWLLFCVPRLFELLTALLKYLDLLQGAAAPCPPDCYTYMIMIIKMIEIYNIATQPYYRWWSHACNIETIAPCAPLMYLLFEKKSLHHQLCSTHYAAVRINNCLKNTFVIKITTIKITNNFSNKWKPSRAYHKIDTFRGEQRWMGHKGRPW